MCSLESYMVLMKKQTLMIKTFMEISVASYANWHLGPKIGKKPN